MLNIFPRPLCEPMSVFDNGGLLWKVWLYPPKSYFFAESVEIKSRKLELLVVLVVERRLVQALAQPPSFPATISNFEIFRERKKTERRSFSVRKKSGSKKQKIQDSEVCNSVGLMKNRKTVMRGEQLPIKLISSATVRDILEAGKKKHAAYNKIFRAGEYCLVYKDGSDVDVIPGTDEPFTLRHYKEELGFGYARINSFLLPVAAFLMSFRNLCKRQTLI